MIDTGASGSASNEVVRKIGLIAALLALTIIVWMPAPSGLSHAGQVMLATWLLR